jgi:hypothetical protein
MIKPGKERTTGKKGGPGMNAQPLSNLCIGNSKNA